MRCMPIRIGNATGFLCSSGVRRPKCSVAGCQEPSAYQCDFPLSGRAKGRTCNRNLCAGHRRQQPVSALFGESVDYCPAHDTAANSQPAPSAQGVLPWVK